MTHNDNAAIDKVISVNDVYKSFGTQDVLKGVNMELSQGEKLVILGRSGTGKSVLIKLIIGLLKPDKGDIRVFSEDLFTLKSKQLRNIRSRIGFSFQESALYDSMTVRENLEFPLVRNRTDLTRKEINIAVDEALEAVGLIQLENHMPASLSGGQKKRIGIARTMILKPDIMLYDEPTAGLDPLTSTEINNLINQINAQYNTSSIIITHDLACAKMVGDRLIMLIDGRFEREGTFEEVFDTDDQRVKAFYNYNFFN